MAHNDRVWRPMSLERPRSWMPSSFPSTSASPHPVSAAPAAPAAPAASAAAISTCEVAIHHAARANITLFLSLLPAELRREVDKYSAWWKVTGSLRVAKVPLLLTATVVAMQFHWRGKQTLVLGLPDERCVYVLNFHEDTNKYTSRRICEGFLREPVASTATEPPLIVTADHSGGAVRILSVWDLDGTLIRTYNAPLVSDGWVLVEDTLTHLRYSGVSYTVPRHAIEGGWSVFFDNGEPRLFTTKRLGPAKLWDLANRKVIYSAPGDPWIAVPKLGALVRPGPNPEVRPLSTGLPLPGLCLDRPSNSFAITDRVVVFANDGKRVTFWDPINPTRFSHLTFGLTWQIVHHSGALVVAQRGKEHLLWHLDLKCGVRCVYEEGRATPVSGVKNISFCGNAFFVRSKDLESLYLVPLVSSGAGSPTDPVAADLPLVRARTLYESAFLYSEPPQDVRLYSDDPNLPPVFYRSIDEVLHF